MVNIFYLNNSGKWKLLMTVTIQFATILIETRDIPQLWKFEDIVNNNIYDSSQFVPKIPSRRPPVFNYR